MAVASGQKRSSTASSKHASLPVVQKVPVAVPVKPPIKEPFGIPQETNEGTAQAVILAPVPDTLPHTEDVSTSITQTWTDQAIKCYLTKADCANCSIPRGNYSFTCQMNKVVPALHKTLGEPDPQRVTKLLPFLHHY